MGGFLQKEKDQDKKGKKTSDSSLVGRSVHKDFPGLGTFVGRVVSHKAGLFKVKYSNGDCGEFERRELAAILVDNEDSPPSSSASSSSSGSGASSSASSSASYAAALDSIRSRLSRVIAPKQVTGSGEEVTEEEGEEEEEEEEEAFDVCSVCDGAGELSLCDGCPRAYHEACLGHPSKLPEGDEAWFCSRCTAQGTVEQPQEDAPFGASAAGTVAAAAAAPPPCFAGPWEDGPLLTTEEVRAWLLGKQQATAIAAPPSTSSSSSSSSSLSPTLSTAAAETPTDSSLFGVFRLVAERVLSHDLALEYFFEPACASPHPSSPRDQEVVVGQEDTCALYRRVVASPMELSTVAHRLGVERDVKSSQPPPRQCPRFVPRSLALGEEGLYESLPSLDAAQASDTALDTGADTAVADTAAAAAAAAVARLVSDLRLCFHNALLFNPPKSALSRAAHVLSRRLNQAVELLCVEAEGVGAALSTFAGALRKGIATQDARRLEEAEHAVAVLEKEHRSQSHRQELGGTEEKKTKRKRGKEIPPKRKGNTREFAESDEEEDAEDEEGKGQERAGRVKGASKGKGAAAAAGATEEGGVRAVVGSNGVMYLVGGAAKSNAAYTAAAAAQGQKVCVVNKALALRLGVPLAGPWDCPLCEKEFGTLTGYDYHTKKVCRVQPQEEQEQGEGGEGGGVGSGAKKKRKASSEVSSSSFSEVGTSRSGRKLKLLKTALVMPSDSDDDDDDDDGDANQTKRTKKKKKKKKKGGGDDGDEGVSEGEFNADEDDEDDDEDEDGLVDDDGDSGDDEGDDDDVATNDEGNRAGKKSGGGGVLSKTKEVMIKIKSAEKKTGAAAAAPPLLQREVSDGKLSRAAFTAGDPNGIADLGGGLWGPGLGVGGSSNNEAALRQLSDQGCFGVGLGAVKGFVLGATFPIVDDTADALPDPPAALAASSSSSSSSSLSTSGSALPSVVAGWGRIAAYSDGRFRVEYSDGNCAALNDKDLRRAISQRAQLLAV